MIKSFIFQDAETKFVQELLKRKQTKRGWNIHNDFFEKTWKTELHLFLEQNLMVCNTFAKKKLYVQFTTFGKKVIAENKVHV